MFGYSRDGYYKQAKRKAAESKKEELVVGKVKEKRKILPRIGTRKLYHLLKEEFAEEEVKVGRDKLFKMLKEQNMLIKKKHSYKVTTNSRHWMKKYPNLLKEGGTDNYCQIWVSDITYIRTDKGFCYLSLITEARSRKIIGYDVSNSLNNDGALRALRQALKSRNKALKTVHHSDRGYQYCSKEYVGLLREAGIDISMTENSDPYENALAERMNRTIKEEFLLAEKFKDMDIVLSIIKESVRLYNEERPHLSLGMKTPEMEYKKRITSVGLRPPEVILTNYFNN